MFNTVIGKSAYQWFEIALARASQNRHWLAGLPNLAANFVLGFRPKP